MAEAADVALAMLETGGTISVIPKRPTPEEQAEQGIEATLARLEAAVARLEARAGERHEPPPAPRWADDHGTREGSTDA